MTESHRILRIGALGAAVAVVLLLALFVVALPAGKDLSALRGTMTPADFGAAVDRHAASLQTTMALDNLFVIAYSTALLGIATLVRTRIRLLGSLALVVALLGGLLDFVENSLTVALIQHHLSGALPEPGWLLTLHLVAQVKYLVGFAAVALLAMGLWSPKPLDRLMSILGVLFPVVGVPGLMVSALVPLTLLWMLALLACGSWLLWRRAAEYAPPL